MNATNKAISYISEKYGISSDYLTVLSASLDESKLTDRNIHLITLLDTSAEGDIYKVWVDLDSEEVSDDFWVLDEQETQAYEERYGKFEAILWEKLSGLVDSDPISVVIWVKRNNIASISQRELYAEVAAKYPEAQEALEISGKPMAVSNSDLSAQIEAD